LATPIIVAQAAAGRLAHFPDIVRLPGGGLLATYREGAHHTSGDGRICLVESADGGLTWGPPRIVVDGPYDDRDPKLAVLADGTVLLSYFVLDWAVKPRHMTHGTFVRRSTDGGQTWSEAVEVGSKMVRDDDGEQRGLQSWLASHGAAVELPGGDLLLPVYGKRVGRKWHRAVAIRSTDGGRTWPADSEVLLGEGDDVHFQEPTLTVVGDQVVAMIRTTADRAYLTRSTDGGHTWAEAQPTDMPASSHHALALSSGEVLVTYGDLSSRFAPHRETVGRLVRHPEQTWDGYGDVQLYDSGHPDQANPSSVEITPGRFLTLGFDVVAATVTGVFTEPKDYPA
jgi:BNR repeat protein